MEGVIDLSGVIDIIKWTQTPITLRTILGVPRTDSQAEQVAIQYNPTTHLSKNDPPILLIHGALDHIVPIEHSQQFHDACKQAGVRSELVIKENLAHGHRFVTEEERTPILNFLQSI